MFITKHFYEYGGEQCEILAAAATAQLSYDYVYVIKYQDRPRVLATAHNDAVRWLVPNRPDQLNNCNHDLQFMLNEQHRLKRELELTESAIAALTRT